MARRIRRLGGPAPTEGYRSIGAARGSGPGYRAIGDAKASGPGYKAMGGTFQEKQAEAAKWAEQKRADALWWRETKQAEARNYFNRRLAEAGEVIPKKQAEARAFAESRQKEAADRMSRAALRMGIAEKPGSSQEEPSEPRQDDTRRLSDQGAANFPEENLADREQATDTRSRRADEVPELKFDLSLDDGSGAGGDQAGTPGSPSDGGIEFDFSGMDSASEPAPSPGAPIRVSTPSSVDPAASGSLRMVGGRPVVSNDLGQAGGFAPVTSVYVAGRWWPKRVWSGAKSRYLAIPLSGESEPYYVSAAQYAAINWESLPDPTDSEDLRNNALIIDLAKTPGPAFYVVRA